MNASQLRQYIIKPVLDHLNLYSVNAENLLVGTACQESHCGEYIAQLYDGPACGIYQMELNTAKDICENFLKYKPHIDENVMDFYIPDLTMSENLRGNLFFATAMCRIHYLRVKHPIPNTIEAQALYYKDYYNTKYGKGTPEEYVRNYRKYGKE